MTIDERKERIVVLFSNHYAFGAQANSNDISLMLNNLMNAVREDALQQAAIDIANVRAEGVAEGAERERERIRKSAQKISTLDEGYHFVDCHFAGTPIYCVPELMLVLSAEEYPTIEEYASVLAPEEKS